MFLIAPGEVGGLQQQLLLYLAVSNQSDQQMDNFNQTEKIALLHLPPFIIIKICWHMPPALQANNLCE